MRATFAKQWTDEHIKYERRRHRFAILQINVDWAILLLWAILHWAILNIDWAILQPRRDKMQKNTKEKKCKQEFGLQYAEDCLDLRSRITRDAVCKELTRLRQKERRVQSASPDDQSHGSTRDAVCDGLTRSMPNRSTISSLRSSLHPSRYKSMDETLQSPLGCTNDRNRFIISTWKPCVLPEAAKRTQIITILEQMISRSLLHAAHVTWIISIKKRWSGRSVFEKDAWMDELRKHVWRWKVIQEMMNQEKMK